MVLSCLVALWLTGEAPAPEKVVAFARSKLGQKVGDGECTALAAEALRHAGIRPRRFRGGSWGEEVAALRDVRPGDILQFEDAVFVRHLALDNGGILTTTTTYPHHTAIVAAVRRRGPRPILVILHQNVSAPGEDDAGRKVVRQDTLNFAEKRRGSIRAYRPVAEEPEESPAATDQ